MAKDSRLIIRLGSEHLHDLPAFGDLTSHLAFSPEDGRIDFHGMRMVLLHLDALTGMRRELVDSFGLEKARGLLSRMGYTAGSRDGEVALRLRSDRNFFERFWTGPQFASLEGMVSVRPVQHEMDPEKGHFFSDVLWINSAEVEEHVASFGPSSEPVCWRLLAYASGFCSTFMGRPILYREIECRGMGDSNCRIVGKPVEAWEDAEGEIRRLQSEVFVNRVFPRRVVAGTDPISRSTLGTVPIDPDELDEEMVGVSAGFNAACHKLQKVAATTATVLFLGETGVGKEMFARTLHRVSPRAQGPFIAVNCAAIPESLIEAELFGVQKGAFTGATQSRVGRFERAQGGTLFLDEVASLTLAVQGKLLRALQQREIERVGDTTTRKVDVRVVAAANIDLEPEIAAGRFRSDLFYRLNVFPIVIPPLRERRDDIPLLLNHLLARFAARHRRSDVPGLTTQAIEALLSYDYPGNIRELENIVERAMILASDGKPIDLHHLSIAGHALSGERFVIDREGNLRPKSPAAEHGWSALSALSKTVLDGGVSWDEVSAVVARDAVARCDGNLTAAARLLHLTRPQLSYRLRKKWNRAPEETGRRRRERRRRTDAS